jgi:DNA-binding MarR family transcriptional regulator
MSKNGVKAFGLHLDATLKVIKQDLTRRFREKGLDITPEQFAMLSTLAEKGELAQKELATHTFKDAPTVSRIIDLLVKKGWINRISDVDDRRKYILNLTTSGQEVYNMAAPIVKSARDIGWNGLSDEDYLRLTQILDRVVENIQR